MSVHVFLCVFMCLSVRLHISVCLFVNDLHVCESACICVCVFVRVNVHLCVNVCESKCVCLFVVCASALITFVHVFV